MSSSNLRAHNGKTGTQYDVFWDECQKFLNEEEAVDDRRHGAITHLARAISIRDFIDQVRQCCPEEIPSVECVHLQFWSKTPTAKKSLQHTGRFKVYDTAEAMAPPAY